VVRVGGEASRNAEREAGDKAETHEEDLAAVKLSRAVGGITVPRLTDNGRLN